MKRRDFFRYLSIGGAGIAISPMVKAAERIPLLMADDKPATNIAEAIAIPRTKYSMPGLYPGRVVKVTDPLSVQDGLPSDQRAYNMIKAGMLKLTGENV